jgi:hypothetical protein
MRYWHLIRKTLSRYGGEVALAAVMMLALIGARRARIVGAARPRNRSCSAGVAGGRSE